MRVKRDKMDDVFSKLVRERADWHCENCGKFYPEGQRQGLHCSHIWGRARQSVRFHPLNAVAHCFACHQFFTANPVLFAEWAESKLGKMDFTRLKILAHQTVKRSKAEKEELYQKMRAELKRLQGERAVGMSGRLEFMAA